MSYVLVTSFAILFLLKTCSSGEDENPESCKFYLYGLLSHIYLNIGIILAQLDRFLAVYWNAEYKQRVTAEKAKYCCGVSNFIGFTIVVLVAIFDPAYTSCTGNRRKTIFTPADVFLDCYPKMFVAIVLGLVSIYVSVVRVRLDRKVNPTVNIPTRPDELVNDGQNKNRVQRIGEDPNRVFEVDVGLSIPNQGASSSKSIRQRNEEMEISPEVNVQTTQEKDQVEAQHESSIKRVNEDPNMFYHVDIVHGKPFLSASSPNFIQAQRKEPTTCFVISAGENQATCLPLDYTEVKLVIKDILKNNLITAIFILGKGSKKYWKIPLRCVGGASIGPIFHNSFFC